MSIFVKVSILCAGSLETTDLKHEQIRQQLLQRINRGEWHPGQRLPSMRDLAATQGTSLAPVRQAMAELVEQGLVESLPGRRGLFVAERAGDREAKLDTIALTYAAATGARYVAGPELSQLLVESVAQEASKRQIPLQVVPYRPIDPDHEDAALLEGLARHRVVVFVHDQYLHWAKYLESRGCEVLYLLMGRAVSGVNCVSWSPYEAMARIVEYVVSLGHRRIAYVGRLGEDVAYKYIAYLEMLERHGLEPIVESDRDLYQAGGYKAAQRLLKARDRCDWPTAIVADTDYKAMGVLDALKEASIRVPDEMSVVGMDGRPIAANCQPALTTVGADRQTIAQQVLDWAQRILQGDQLPRLKQTIEPVVIERRSAIRRMQGGD